MLLALAVHPASAAGVATSIEVTPKSATITADERITFGVTAVDAQGQKSDVTSASTFSVDDPRGVFEKSIYQAGKVGVWTVTITYQSLTTTANITVRPGALDEISINPNSDPETIALGTKRTFIGHAFDADNNDILDTPITWSTDASVGAISSRGVFTPSAVGNGHVRATSGSVTASVPVRVIGTLTTEIPPAATSSGASGSSGGTTKNNNANSNTAVNTSNTNATENINASDGASTAAVACSTGKAWLWIFLLAALLGAIALLFSFFPVSAIWPVVAALAAAAVLVYLQRNYGCDAQRWWGWLAIVGTVALTMLAIRQFPPAAKSS